jgi:carbonic anhydrase
MNPYNQNVVSNENDNNQPNEELSNLEDKFQNSFRFMQKPKNSNPITKRSNRRKSRRTLRKRMVYKNPINILKNGWLKVSSYIFRNPNKYPQIGLPDGSNIEIPTNRNGFRINETYDPNKKPPNFPPSRYYFWFRLSGKNFYYSTGKNDINVLGSISAINILETYKESDIGLRRCFRILDRERKEWRLCAKTKKEKAAWICVIKTMLGYKKIRECKAKKSGKGAGKGDAGGDEVNQPTVITRKVQTPVILIPLPSKKCNEDWDYINKGQDWNCECSEGKEQSPINLPPRHHSIISPIKPIFSFNEVKAKKETTTSDGQHKTNKILSIKNKNNALRIKHKYFGKAITLDGGLYTAEEIVFHTPSEHTIDGRRFEMEMQVIFYGQNKGAIAKQVVLSFLFKRKAGVYNKFIDDLDFFNLPNSITKRRPLLNNIFIPKIFYNANYGDVALMKEFSFYTYQGSLTQPPCSERTINYVAAKPIKLGSSALQMFQEAIRIPDKISSTGEVISSNIPPENHRITQPLNGRAVFYYDKKKFCNNGIKKPSIEFGYNRGRKKVKGHYEKVLKKMTEYYYVNGPMPSGLPGAYVVSPQEAIGINNDN